ncbi:hypothetical protein MRB53_006432 [Persea americana]|uniref:Uncharacterized protein n=1 Tax=Persea americana TaxID=3435 RepID=A0ACC2MH62_PERAE|nr:hypothetical protein MRB53_006432 [Persea americana]
MPVSAVAQVETERRAGRVEERKGKERRRGIGPGLYCGWIKFIKCAKFLVRGRCSHMSYSCGPNFIRIFGRRGCFRCWCCCSGSSIPFILERRCTMIWFR